jgi:hypothetical protein
MKYPHTPYFSFSPSVDREDVRESGYFDINNFINCDIIFTTKMDGSNCSMTREKIAARNGNHANGISFDMAKALHATIAHAIPSQYVIFGEWLYAMHSIHYTELESFFQIFGVFDIAHKKWLSWISVYDVAGSLGLQTVEFSQIYNFGNVRELEAEIIRYGEMRINKGHEGIVVRSAHDFAFGEFKNNVAKYVRKNHVQTTQHWSKQPLVRNKLK